MRVLYFTERDSPHDQRFLNALVDTSHQIYVLRQFSCFPELREGVIELGWPAGQPDWSNWFGWQAGKAQFAQVLGEVQPDLVHAGPIQGPALLTALVGFQPLVTMSWGSDILRHAQRSPWMRFATKYTLDRTEIFLGDCQAVVDEASKYDFPFDKMVRFPWGVDLDHFSPETGEEAGFVLRKSLGWADNFILLCNRTWASLYGVDLLAQAFVSAVMENAELRLFLIGEGPQSNLIRQILAPVAEKVSLPGRLDREMLPGAYCAADLFVNPSHSDGSSISLLEAMACGRPVLVSNIPGNKEWVNPGEVGDIFRDGDVIDLKNKILALAESPDLVVFGKKARQLVEEQADWKKNFQKLLFAYNLAV